MAEHDDELDELDELRKADPVRQVAVPSSESAQARVLFERIIMTDTEIDTTIDTTDRRRPPSRVWAAAAAVVVLIGVAGAAIALDRDDNDASPDPIVTDTTGDQPITPGGGMASCVEQYSLDALADRDAAFEGTVVSVDGDTITFDVNAWFRGGDSDTTTRRGASTLGGMTSAGSGVSLEPGTRLLVAGDDDFAWGCGFTQLYDEAVAAQWADALG